MDDDEITQRLRDAGRQPVPGEVRDRHLSRLHAPSPAADAPTRFGRLAVAAAAFVGFAVGSTGFAVAGALPDPAQQVAHDVLAVVQVDVEDPRANRGRCVSQVAKGSGTEAEKAAAKDACPEGKPDHAGKGKGKARGQGRPDHAGPSEGHPNDDTTDCKGRPPWAGKGGKDLPAEERGAFEQACGRGQDDAAEAGVPASEQDPAAAGGTGG